MTGGDDGLIDRLAMKRALARWRRAVAEAPQQPLAEIAGLRRQARRHLQQIRRYLEATEAHLSPGAEAAFLAGAPLGTDWLWRPPLFCAPVEGLGGSGALSPLALGAGAILFHDCPLAEIALCQTRDPAGEGRAPWGLRCEVYHFAGSFLSLAIDLPPEALRDLQKRHLVRVEVDLEAERPLGLLLRLNIRHGPNHEQIRREVPLTAGRGMVEFDLFYTELNERRVQQAWIDLIFADPAQNQITLRDLRVSRRPRAEL